MFNLVKVQLIHFLRIYCKTCHAKNSFVWEIASAYPKCYLSIFDFSVSDCLCKTWEVNSFYSWIMPVFPASSSLSCLLRNLGGSNSVCVCNSTYCDTVPPLPQLLDGQVAVYSSSQDGDRLAYNTTSAAKTSSGCQLLA